MRHAARWIIACLGLSLAACSSWESLVENYRTVSPTAYTERIDAARAISDSARRDQLLSSVVLDAAAHANDLEDVRYGIRSISSDEIKEQTAVDAAWAFYKRGQYGWGRRVAMMIGDSKRRDEVLAKLAEGGPVQR